MLKELGFLLKYEFRFYFRILPPLYLVLMLITLFMHLQWNFTESGDTALYFILYFFWNAIMMAMGIITIVEIIQRFVNNFMKEQGAIMFTLPITTWTLLASKVIAAFCMFLMSSIVIYISFLVFAKGLANWLFSLISTQLLNNIQLPNSAEIMIIIFVICAISVHFVLLIFVSIAISYLLPRFRFAAGCGIFLVVSSFLEQPVFNLVNKKTIFNPEYYLNSGFNNDMYISMIPYGITTLVFAALYFWVTGFLLKRTYNLE
jgi:hypothetical protein